MAARGAVTAECRGLGSGLDDTSKGEQVPRTRACLPEGGSERRGTRSSQGGGGGVGGTAPTHPDSAQGPQQPGNRRHAARGKLRGGGRDAAAPV